MGDMIINQKSMLENFYYDDGNLFRKKDNKKCGHTDKRGYTRMSIKKKKFLVHRIIFLMHYGYFPEEIDHIDGNPANNKIENLRGCNRQQNCFNQRLKKTNVSKHKGVHFDKSRNLWKVSYKLNGKMHHVGRFKDLELASLIADEIRRKYHGEFFRHG